MGNPAKAPGLWTDRGRDGPGARPAPRRRAQHVGFANRKESCGKRQSGAPDGCIVTGKGRTPMPLAMNREVFITCAVTGSGATQDRSPHVPRSPAQIAESAIAAAKAG